MKVLKIFIGLILSVSILYSGYWFFVAHTIKTTILAKQTELDTSNDAVQFQNVSASVKGFPKEYQLTWRGDLIGKNGKISIPEIRVKSWFSKGQPVDITMPKGLTLTGTNNQSYSIDRLGLSFAIPANWPGDNLTKEAVSQWQSMQERLDIDYFEIQLVDKKFHLSANGYMTLDHRLQPAGVIHLKFNEVGFLEELKKNIASQIQTEPALLPQEKKKLIRQHGTLSALTSSKDMTYTIRMLNNAIYLSFLKLGKIPFINWKSEQAAVSPPLPAEQ